VALASAGPYANHLHLALDKSDALPAAQKKNIKNIRKCFVLVPLSNNTNKAKTPFGYSMCLPSQPKKLIMVFPDFSTTTLKQA